MNKKTITTLIMTAGILITACLPNTSPTEAPTNNSNSSVLPTTTTITEGNSPTTIESTGTSIDPNLACNGGKTSANTTPSLTEGPYYTPGSPENASLFADGMAGIKLIVSGYVYDTNCQPVANAWLDFWQADADGVYDNSGYTLRGHQYTDTNGHYELITVVPGIYPGRTEHIHFKVQAPNGKVITSQLFFPGVTQNDSDGIYNPNLLLSIQETGTGLIGQFNFIVPAQ